ncbi:UNVERIFIED_CONTAM: hypothetical protein Sradi_3274400 [Sesamum radiatum]|uniref:Uncharacterized protein n=1 Tax=Sesamum radiatum TaxID=300843 RepID=A0AAW2R084_SESRA
MDLGGGMSMMALIFSGLASMPLSEIMYPRNFPPLTPKVHLAGFNFMPKIFSTGSIPPDP